RRDGLQPRDVDDHVVADRFPDAEDDDGRQRHVARQQPRLRGEVGELEEHVDQPELGVVHPPPHHRRGGGAGDRGREVDGLEEFEIERLHRRPDPEEHEEDDHRRNEGVGVEVVAAVHPPHEPAGAADHTLTPERGIRKAAGLPQAACGRPLRNVGYFAASAMALFPCCSASARAWSTVASPCPPFWIPAPSACMTPSFPRFIGYRRPYLAILANAWS